MLDLAAEGNYVAVRPSGTEPLVKFYLFAYQLPQSIVDLDAITISSPRRCRPWKTICGPTHRGAPTDQP